MQCIELKKRGETELLFYKKSIIFILFLVLGMSACSAKKEGVSDKEYMRSNNASQKALDKLDRE